MVEASDAIYEAQKTLQGSDSAPIKEAVTNAQASVDKALARAESEALRLRAMTDLDECEKTLVQIGHEVREGGFEERIGDFLTHGEKLCRTPGRLRTLRMLLLWCAARGAVDAVNHAGEQFEKAQAQKRAEERRASTSCWEDFNAWTKRTAVRGVPKFARKAGGGVQKPLFKVKRVSTVPVEAPPPPPIQPRIIPKAPKSPLTPRNVSPPETPAAATPATVTKTPSVQTPAGGHTLDSWIAAKNLGNTLLNYMISPGTCTISRR